MAARFTRFLIIAAFVMLSTCAAADPKADVMVKPTSETTAAEVLLGNVATVVSEDATLAQKLESVVICQSPLPGRTRNLTRDQIIIAMRKYGIADGTANLVCPSQVSVSRTSCKVSGQAIFETAQNHILADTPWQGMVTVEPVRLPLEQNVPTGSIELRVRDNTQIRKGRNSIPVEILVDNQLQATAYVSVVVKVFAPVLVATQAISRGEQVTTVNCILQERDITNLPSDVAQELPSTDVIATVPISQGAVIRRGWICEPPVIRSGDTVTVLVSSKSVRISDKGTAAMDGRVGEQIKVRLMGDVREVRGIVVGQGLVEIKLADRRN